MKAHFENFAAYNRWANARLYEAALALTEIDYQRDTGVFFRSMSGTLNHLLVTDRIWMWRLTGAGEHYDRGDIVVHEDRGALGAARVGEDDRIVRYVASLDEAALAGVHSYCTTKGKPFEQPRADILAHFFNHQTHHRGQAHAILSIVTGREPPPLDLLAFQRGVTAPDLRSLVT